MSVESTVRAVTTYRLTEMKQRGEKIAMLTSYDYSMAKIVDAAGVDERELATVPVGHVVAAVAGDAAALVHDGVGGLGDTIDERRLAHVRIAYDVDET